MIDLFMILRSLDNFPAVLVVNDFHEICNESNNYKTIFFTGLSFLLILDNLDRKKIHLFKKTIV